MWGYRNIWAFHKCILHEHLVCANSFPPQIPLVWIPWHQTFLLPSSLSLPVSGATLTLSTLFHLLLGQASFSTMEHSGVAYHCLNIQPCHQQYPISMLNFMLLQSKVHTPTTAAKPLPNLSQPISTSRPQALVCLTAHMCDRVQHLF